jgi:FkbM family methyltransferase
VSLRSGLRRRARLAAKRFGLDVRPFTGMSDSAIRLARICEHREVSLVVDVGANDGDWAASLRLGGYPGRIVSIEPQSSEFARLAERAALDPLWTGLRMAVGRKDEQLTLPLSRDTVWTSFLPVMNETADTEVVREEVVTMTTLDTSVAEFLSNDERVFLKLDVQGYELEVIAGASSVFQHVVAALVEVILVPVYEEQPSREEIFAAFEALGLRLAGVENGHIIPETGEELYIDALFVRA